MKSEEKYRGLKALKEWALHHCLLGAVWIESDLYDGFGDILIATDGYIAVQWR